MSQQPSPILPDLLDKLLDNHIKKEKGYYDELYRRTDDYKEQLEKCKLAIAERRFHHKVRVEEDKQKKKQRDLYHLANRMVGMWIAQDPDNRILDLPREETPFQHAVQVLIGNHHMTIMDDSENLDIDGGNPAEERVRTYLLNKRRKNLKGTTHLEAELKRLDMPEVVQSILRELWAKYQDECEGMGLVPDSKPKRRGPKKADYDTQQHEAKLKAEWKRAYNAGTCKTDFARDKGYSLVDFDKLLNRVSEREKAAKREKPIQ